MLRLALLFSLILLPALNAQEHVVTSADLSRELQSAAGTRAQTEAALERFFGSSQARSALQSARLDPAAVQKAIPYLTDQELARLAARAGNVESNFAGTGVSLTNQQVTYIIVGVIAIAIIAIVASR